MEPLQFWAYRHTQGSILVKRYLGPVDIEEARESPFVMEIMGPFEAENINEARVFAMARLARPVGRQGAGHEKP